MRIVCFFHKDDAVSGGGKSNLRLIELLSKVQDFELIVINPMRNKNVARRLDELKIENYRMEYEHLILNKDESSMRIERIQEMRKINREICAALKKILNGRGIDLVYSGSSVIWIGGYIARKYNAKHIWHFRELARDWNYLIPSTSQFMNQLTDKYIMISKAARKYWEDYGCDAQKMVTIYNGISMMANYQARVKLKCERRIGKILRIVFIGQIQPLKGQVDFLQRILEMPKEIRDKISITFYGAGNDSERLNDLIKTCSERLDVINKGYKTNVFEVLDKYDVGIVNSYNEAFGRSTVEYLMNGLYVLASNRGANPEIINNELLGTIFQYENTASLQDALVRAMEILSRSNRNRYEVIVNQLEKFTDYNNANNIEKTIRGLIASSDRLKYKGKKNEIIFPYHMIPIGSKIVLCGESFLTQEFRRHAVRFGVVEILECIESKGNIFDIINRIEVMKQSFKSIVFDYVLICVLQEDKALKIKTKLIECGIEEAAIKWDGLVYILDGFYQNVYFDMLEHMKLEWSDDCV